jgi:hypothetical protein
VTTPSNLLNKILAWVMRRVRDELAQLNGPSPASVDIYRMDIPYLMTLAHRPPADPPAAAASRGSCLGRMPRSLAA